MNKQFNSIASLISIIDNFVLGRAVGILTEKKTIVNGVAYRKVCRYAVRFVTYGNLASTIARNNAAIASGKTQRQSAPIQWVLKEKIKLSPKGNTLVCVSPFGNKRTVKYFSDNTEIDSATYYANSGNKKSNGSSDYITLNINDIVAIGKVKDIPIC